MAKLFPLRSEAPSTEGPPRVVDLADEDADAVFGALSSNTARRIYARLEEEPGTASDVADAVDSSIQNVRYHLENLEDAGLIEVVDTWYSSRGNEMNVYATANGPLIVTSDRSRAAQLREAVSRLVGGVGVLAGASLLVQAAARRFGTPGDDAAPGGADYESGGRDDVGFTGGDAADDEAEDDAAAEDADATADDADAEAADVPEDEPMDAEPAADRAADDSGGLLDALGDWIAETVDAVLALPPGLLFFLGGLTVLAMVGGWWYWTRYRPIAG